MNPYLKKPAVHEAPEDPYAFVPCAYPGCERGAVHAWGLRLCLGHGTACNKAVDARPAAKPWPEEGWWEEGCAFAKDWLSKVGK